MIVLWLFHYIYKNKQKNYTSEADLFIVYLLSRSPNKQFKRRNESA